MSSGKSAIGIEGNEWYRPVLYLRWADNDGGQLFKDSQVKSNNAIQTSPTLPVKPTKNPPSSQTMKLNKDQRKKLQEALISAFPTEADLERLLAHELDIRLNTIASGGNYTDIVFNLLKWSESQGRTQDLIQAAYKVNSGNPQLKEFITEIGIADVRSLESNPETPLRENVPSNPRSEFYKKRIAAKQEELAAIESQLTGTLSAVDELKLNKQAEGIMREIDELQAKLKQL